MIFNLARYDYRRLGSSGLLKEAEYDRVGMAAAQSFFDYRKGSETVSVGVERDGHVCIERHGNFLAVYRLDQGNRELMGLFVYFTQAVNFVAARSLDCVSTCIDWPMVFGCIEYGCFPNEQVAADVDLLDLSRFTMPPNDFTQEKQLIQRARDVVWRTPGKYSMSIGEFEDLSLCAERDDVLVAVYQPERGKRSLLALFPTWRNALDYCANVALGRAEFPLVRADKDACRPVRYL